MPRRPSRLRRSALVATAVGSLLVAGGGLASATPAAPAAPVVVVGGGVASPGGTTPGQGVVGVAVRTDGTGTFFYRDRDLTLSCQTPVAARKIASFAVSLECTNTAGGDFAGGQLVVTILDQGRADRVTMAVDGITVRSITLSAGDIQVR